MQVPLNHLMRSSLLQLPPPNEPCAETERNHRRQTFDWLSNAKSPLDRHCYDPGHAVGSVFVVSLDGRVALIFHSKLERWLQPGGHAECFETDLRSVAAREAREEMGLRVNASELTLLDVDVHRIPSRLHEPSHLHFDFRFLCVVPPIALSASSDASRVQWFSQTELARMELDDGIWRMVDKAVTCGLVAA